MRRSNILDPIHEALDRRVWDKPGAPRPVLKPHHAHWIKKHVYLTLDRAGYTDIHHWLTLVFTGSLTTYQYSDDSDVDISLFVDAQKFPEWSRAEMIAVMVDNLDGQQLPGTPFPMQCFVVGEGITPHDLYKPGLRSGYEIDANKWIVPPERERIHDVVAEENGFYAWALQMADKMERLLRYEPEQAKRMWHNIHNARRRDMRAGKGDYAESNVIYKMLANRGLFPKLEEAGAGYIAKIAMPQGFPHDEDKHPAKTVYHKFRPDPPHPKEPGEPNLPFIYDPHTSTVHLGPPESWHWQLVQRVPELRDAYTDDDRPMWDQPAAVTSQEMDLGHVHGSMRWPSRELSLLGEHDPDTQQRIAEALGAPMPEGNWNFSSFQKQANLATEIYEATVEGGGTARNLAGEGPTARYGFAPDKGSEERIPLHQFSPTSVQDYIGAHLTKLEEPGKFIGTWVKDGTVFLDITEGHDDYEEAYKRAFDGHQKSMWDNVIEDEIPVRGLDYEPEDEVGTDHSNPR